MKFIQFKNPGILMDIVPSHIYDALLQEIENIDKDKKHNHRLAGNIKEEYTFPNGAQIIRQYILDLAKAYEEEYGLLKQISILENDLPLVLKDSHVWINYQSKAEFNPLHIHSGIFSFVIWLKIPYDIEEELENENTKNSNKPVAGHFEFAYTNILGQICTTQIQADASYEGKIVFFPAMLNHQVYPYYSTDDKRISIAGNLVLSTENNLCNTK